MSTDNAVTYTVAMIKAPTVGRGHAGDILTKITQAGFVIVALDHKKLCPTTIRAFYKDHVERPYFSDLENSVGNGRAVIAMVLAKKGDAIADWRSLMGATSSKTAAPGTIRHAFGGHNYLGAAAPMADNAVHGSDSPAAAEYEYKVLFGSDWPENPLANFVEE